MKSSSRHAESLFNLGQRDPINIIGLNSGTSADGLDIALVQFSRKRLPVILKQRKYSYPDALRKKIIALGEPEFIDGVEWLKLDSELGIMMGNYVRKFNSSLKKAGLEASLIGSHGQTIRHLPLDFANPLTLQVADPSLIARITGLPVIADFRRSDIAAGGQGAPLSPLLHELLFRDKRRWRAIVNIGGIANATILPPRGSRGKLVAGDCGPGNILVDSAMNRLFSKPFDEDGMTAFQGTPPMAVVTRVLHNRFFELKPPKSTGRELFGKKFLDDILRRMAGETREDIVAAISEITVAGIIYFILRFGPRTEEIYLCGGGAKNRYFVERLRQLLPVRVVGSTGELGYDADHLESFLWAFLAYKFIRQEPVETRSFTGAGKPYIPGKLCLP